jgi:hypothetical protein
MIDLSQSRITRSTKRGELAQIFVDFPPMQKGLEFQHGGVEAADRGRAGKLPLPLIPTSSEP